MARSKRSRRSPKPRPAALRLEGLEARDVPATYIWDGGAGTAAWGDDQNWFGNVAPDTLNDTNIDLVFNAPLVTTQNIPGLVVDSITFNTGGSKITLSQALTLDQGEVVNNAGTNAITGAADLVLTGFFAMRLAAAAGTTLVFEADLTGPSGLMKDTGGGTVEFRGTASYQGPTLVRDGVLALNNDEANLALPGSALTIGDDSGAAGSAKVRLLQGGEIPNAAPVWVAADGVLDLNGHIDTVGALTLAGGSVATGGGTLTLTGNVNVTQNSLIQVGAAAGKLDLGAQDRTITVAAGKNLTVTAQIVGTGALIKDGDGTLTFDTDGPNLPNTYTGVTKVKQGGLLLDNALVGQALAGDLEIGDGVGPAGSAFVKLQQSLELPTGKTVLVKSDGLLDLNAKAEHVTVLNLLGGAQVTTGGSLLTLDGGVQMLVSNGLAAKITGNIYLPDPTPMHNFIVGDDSAASDLVIDGAISGPGGLRKGGAGTLELRGSIPNTFTGYTTIAQGTLALNQTAANGAISKTVLVGYPGPGVLRLDHDHQIPDDATINVYTGTLALNDHNDAIGPLNIQADSHVTMGTGKLTLAADVQVLAPSTGATITGNIDLGGADRTFTVYKTVGATDLVITGVISGAGGLIKDGGGTMLIEGPANSPNTYTGQTWVKSGVLALNDFDLEVVSSTLVIGDGVGVGGSAVVRLLQGSEIPDGATVTINADGLLDLNGLPEAIDGLTLAGGQVTTGNELRVSGDITVPAGHSSKVTGNLELLSGNHTFTVGGSLFIDAVVSGPGGLVKEGPGLLVLTKDNTYTGPTTINDGQLFIHGSQPDSPVTVNGGELGGIGSIGTLTGTGGQVSPGGEEPGTFTTKDLALGGATLVADLFAADGFDQLKVTGPVNLTGGTLVTKLYFVPAAGSQFRVIDNDGADAVAGTFNGLAEGATFAVNGRTLQITYQGGDGNDVVLTDVTPLPPPPPPPPPGGGGGGGGSSGGGGGGGTGSIPGLVGYREFAVGADAGGGGVTLYNPDGSARFTTDPFPGLAGGVRAAAADFTGDGVADLVVGTGPGSATHVRVLDGLTKAELFVIDPFEPTFTGGVYVAAGDVTGDGRADLVVTPDEGGGPRCRVFSGDGFGPVADFFGIDDPNFRGGARAAVGDVDGDGAADLVVAAGFGGGPRVAAFSGASLASGPVKLFADFLAFESALRNGTYVAAGDVDGDGRAEVIAGGGPGGGPRVSVFSGRDLLGNIQTRTADYFAGDVANRGGVRVAVKDLDGDARADLVTGAGPGAGSRATGYYGSAVPVGGVPPEAFAIDAFPGFSGGVFVG